MPSKTKAAILTEDAILTAAAARRYGHVLPLPEDTDATSAKATKLLKAMLAAGLIEEHATSSAKNAWRSDEQGKHTLLRMTETGRQTLSATTEAAVVPAAADAPVPATQAERDRPRAPGGKLGQVLAAVQHGEGASLAALIAMTGWQPHTVRASLTRLRQGGVPIQLIQSDGQKRYSAGVDGAPAQ